MFVNMGPGCRILGLNGLRDNSDIRGASREKGSLDIGGSWNTKSACMHAFLSEKYTFPFYVNEKGYIYLSVDAQADLELHCSHAFVCRVIFMSVGSTCIVHPLLVGC